LLVGDDSGDSSVEDVAFSLRDARIAWIRNPKRLGPALNHRNLVHHARGDLIAILNHDDLWAPGFLERLCAELDTDRTAILAFCDHGVVDTSGTPLVEAAAEMSRTYGRAALREGLHRPFQRLVMQQTIPLAMGTLFRNRRDVLRRLPGWSAGAYDMWIAGALAATREGAIFVREGLSKWRVHSGSLTAAGGVEGRAGVLEVWSRLARHEGFRDFRTELLRRAATGWVRLWLHGLRQRDEKARVAAIRGVARLIRRSRRRSRSRARRFA
jgi:glycosyltransferase involved in cell wall biosynthesis